MTPSGADKPPVDPSLPPIEVLPELGDGLLRSLGLLVVLLLGAIIVLWAIRRFLNHRGSGVGAGLIRVIEVRRLEAGRALYVVEADNQRLLLGVGESGWTKLARLGEPVSDFELGSPSEGSTSDGDLTQE